jgi:hypothetical protein
MATIHGYNEGIKEASLKKIKVYMNDEMKKVYT